MFRRIISIISAAGLVFLFGIPVFAADNRGSIYLIPGGQPINGQITLYRIGSLTENSCRITDGLADWIISRQETQTEEFLQWALLQSWEDKRTCMASDEQSIRFENLEAGLYLLEQTETTSGDVMLAPFLVALSEESNMDVVITMNIDALAEIPRTGDYPAPIFMAMLLSFTVVIFMVIVENRKK